MRVRLGDVCTVVSGTTPRSSNDLYWDGDLNWITPAELSDDSYVIHSSERKITELAVKESSLKSFPCGTVILSSRAPIGKVAVAGTEMYCNQGFKNFICSSSIFNFYLFWFLKSKTEFLNSLGRGATFKEVSKAIVENIEIPLPSLAEQKRIADTFDRVSDLIAKRKQQLEKLDELVKARFVEMFGDKAAAAQGWIKSPLVKVCDVRDGTHDSPSYFNIGYPLVTSKNVTGGALDLSECSLISEADYIKICERSKVDIGDILMPMIGTVGKPVIVEIEPNFAIKNVALIKFKGNSSVLNIYVKVLLESDYFDQAILSKIRGGTQKFIALGDIRKLEIPVPPLNLQTQFADFVSQVNQFKAQIQQSLHQLETLKKSLMQQYFG